MAAAGAVATALQRDGDGRKAPVLPWGLYNTLQGSQPRAAAVEADRSGPLLWKRCCAKHAAPLVGKLVR